MNVRPFGQRRPRIRAVQPAEYEQVESARRAFAVNETVAGTDHAIEWAIVSIGRAWAERNALKAALANERRKVTRLEKRKP